MLSVGSIFQPMNDFFLERFGTPDGSPVVFRFDKFGSSISQDDFRSNPADPNSPFSAAVAREKVSDLVNRVPAEVGDGAYVVLLSDSTDSIYSDLLLRPAQPFLPEGTSRAERDSIMDAFNAMKADALKVWDRSELTSVSGTPLPFRPTEAIPVDWCDPASTDVWSAHSFAVNESNTPPILLEPLTWRRMPSEQQIVQVMATAEVATLAEAAQPPLAAVLRPAALRRPAVPGLTGREDVSLGDNLVSVRRDDLSSSLVLRHKLFNFDARQRLHLQELIVESAPVQPVTTSNVTISFEYCLVTLQRKWLKTTFIDADNWKIPGQEQGSANRAGEPGSLTHLPVGFLAVRNLRISASWSDADRANLTGAMSLGPFDISASLGNSEVTQPGLQIVGWLLQELPPLPPNPPTDGAARPDPTPGSSRTYTVKKGDTLRKIAQKCYGDRSKFRKIQQANQLGPSGRLKVGQVLRIP
jgi:hypothetical protein